MIHSWVLCCGPFCSVAGLLPSPAGKAREIVRLAASHLIFILERPQVWGACRFCCASRRWPALLVRLARRSGRADVFPHRQAMLSMLGATQWVLIPLTGAGGRQSLGFGDMPMPIGQPTPYLLSHPLHLSCLRAVDLRHDPFGNPKPANKSRMGNGKRD